MNTHRLASRLSLLAALGALGAGSLAAAPATAIVPPKECHLLKFKGKKYDIRADQIACSGARKIAKSVLGHHHPKGWHCQNGDPGSNLQFTCDHKRKGRPAQVVYAIKR